MNDDNSATVPLSRRHLLGGALAVVSANMLVACSSRAASAAATSRTPPGVPSSAATPANAPSPTVVPAQDTPTPTQEALVSPTVIPATPTSAPSPTAQSAPTVTPDNSPEINQFLTQLGNWEPAVVKTSDTRKLETGKVVADGQTYQCTVDTKSQVASQKEILAAGSDSGALWPGALVQGQGVATGSLAVLPLPRAPMTLSINLAIPNPTIAVSDPYSGTVQQAISTLQRAADQRLGGIDVVPATMSYEREEAYSFNQAMLSVGISASYASAFAGAGLDTSFSRERQVGAHSIVVKFYQPMYTIQFDDDRVSTPADLFASTVSVSDFKQQETLGRLGSNNPPVLIKSVTYGRMMVFTMTSTHAESAQRMITAINAVYGNFSGSAKVDTGDVDVIRNSRIDLKVFGGQQDAALAAIQSGDLKRFFTRAEAANAVPLTYQAEVLNGQPIQLNDAVTFQAQTCNKMALPNPTYSYTVRLSNINYDVYVYVNGALVKHQVGGSATVAINSRLGTGDNTLEIKLGNANCFKASLNMSIDVNGAQKVTRGYYNDLASCFYPADWKYKVNKDTGIVTKVS
ncbi:MAG TPA: thiol-activated cytolysin family protein [Chloroflexota bacterium]|nr:thiol-activated cytolysin family protein [Chloroflexota bacterium]